MKPLYTLLLSLIWTSFGMAQSTWIVPDDFSTIQNAIGDSAVVDGDTVLVKPGTYIENLDFLGKGIHLRSEAGPEQTVIDGNQTGSVVVFNNGEEEDSVLQGFTITNGTGTLYWDEIHGGGIFCFGTDPTITENIITDNAARNGLGAGIACLSYGRPHIVNNLISHNEALAPGAYGGGGGIHAFDTSPFIEKNTICHNIAQSHGGGIEIITRGTPTISENVIFGNTAIDGSGGGIRTYDIDYPPVVTINDNLIYENSAVKGGGVSVVWSVLSNNIIRNNTAESGGGLYVGNGIVNVINNIMYENVADFGGGIWAAGDLRFYHNTIFNNSALQGGGLLLSNYSASEAVNSILWGNQAPTGAEICLLEDASLYITTSNVEGGQLGVWYGPDCVLIWDEGMIDVDPLFIDPSNGDLHLTRGSPCIDAGIPFPHYFPSTDFEGDPRVVGPLGGLNRLAVAPPEALPDMGADEFCLVKKQHVSKSIY